MNPQPPIDSFLLLNDFSLLAASNQPLQWWIECACSGIVGWSHDVDHSDKEKWLLGLENKKYDWHTCWDKLRHDH